VNKAPALPVVLITVAVALAAQSPSPTAPSAGRPGDVVPIRPAAPPPKKEGDPNKGTGVIRGRITLSNGRPARKASIQLTGTSSARATAADENGNYEFNDLSTDTFFLSAGRPGYLVLEYGQTRAFERGEPIELKDGETRKGVDVTLLPSSAVSGRIVDEFGDPLENVTVRLLQVQYFSNRRQLIDIAAAGGRATDDTGAFRIYGVPPGDYVIRASVTDRLPTAAIVNGVPVDAAAADLPGYAPTFFPGASDPGSAALIHVNLAQDVNGIDFALVATPTARVSGRAFDSRNQPVGVFLARSQRSSGYAERPMRAISSNDGNFTFDNVAPGEYVLQTTGGRRDPSTEPDFAMTYVTVAGQNVSDVVLQGTSGSTVSGRVVFEGLAANAKPPQIQLTAWPVDFERSPMQQNDIARTRVGDDGRFALGGLQGPRRIRLLQAPSAWQLKAVIVNGLDVTDEPLSFGSPRESLANVQIVVTSTGPVISGHAVDAQGRESTDYSVVAFSTDAERWYQRSRYVASARGREAGGAFLIRSLPPGEYYVAAVDTLMDAEGWGEWQDPEFLRKLSANATKVTLADGQTLSMSLRLLQR